MRSGKRKSRKSVLLVFCKQSAVGSNTKLIEQQEYREIISPQMVRHQAITRDGVCTGFRSGFVNAIFGSPSYRYEFEGYEDAADFHIVLRL